MAWNEEQVPQKMDGQSIFNNNKNLQDSGSQEPSEKEEESKEDGQKIQRGKENNVVE
jgi:hypothetical protein